MNELNISLTDYFFGHLSRWCHEKYPEDPEKAFQVMTLMFKHLNSLEPEEFQMLMVSSTWPDIHRTVIEGLL
jgi:hypothetical protein